MSEPPITNSEDDPDMPPRLREDLRQMYVKAVRVPAGVDNAILALAARAMARPPRNRRWIWVGRIAAAAAVLVIVITGVVFLKRPGRETVPDGAGANGTAARPAGKDILVAFDLARQLRAGGPITATWDVNGDGKIDQTDVDLLAHEAVALPRAGGSL